MFENMTNVSVLSEKGYFHLLSLFFSQIDLLSSRLSEKLVLHVLKFVGAEIESSKHIGFYAQWSHFILMHHGLWIRRKWKELLPVLNQLQKGRRQYKKIVKQGGHITYIL